MRPNHSKSLGLLSLTLGLALGAMVLAGCEGEAGLDGADGSNGIDGDNGSNGDDGSDGKDGKDGEDGEDALSNPPILEGHNGDHGMILPYNVQMAYNDDTFFVRVEYRGNEGVRHQYLRYTDGAWQKEGGDRRDAQASLDGDADQGDQGQLSTIYEQRTSIMWNDPSATSNVTNFDKFGCFLTCHNDARHMPEWTSANGHDGKYISPDQVTDGGKSNNKVLDLWHWRGARSNPIARSDDQHIRMLDWPNVARTSGDDGGRKGDAGKSVFWNQGLDDDGNPKMLLDPATTWGDYTFDWDNFWGTPFYYMTEPNAENLGHNTPNPVMYPFEDAEAEGFTAIEGDTVPRRILRAGEGSRADITAYGTEFIPQSADGNLGVWKVQLQRLMDTQHDDDVKLVAGQTYEVGFEVHLWEYTTRDHYISFPLTVSLGEGGDIEAQYLGAGTGSYPLPGWENTDKFPVTRVDLFQPGINTWEFLVGDNQKNSKVYNDPVTGKVVGQVHGGAVAVAGATNSCASCHTTKSSDTTVPDSGFNAGAMEAITGRRGGIWSDTPTD